MSNVSLFPVSKSRGRIRAIADAIDAPAEEADAAWRREQMKLARAMLDQGVDDDRVDIELLMLLHAAQDAVLRRQAARKGAATRRERVKISVVPPRQGDLFDTLPAVGATPAQSREGDVDVA